MQKTLVDPSCKGEPNFLCELALIEQVGMGDSWVELQRAQAAGTIMSHVDKCSFKASHWINEYLSIASLNHTALFHET